MTKNERGQSGIDNHHWNAYDRGYHDGYNDLKKKSTADNFYWQGVRKGEKDRANGI